MITFIMSSLLESYLKKMLLSHDNGKELDKHAISCAKRFDEETQTLLKLVDILFL